MSDAGEPRSRPVHVSILVPCRNEEGYIGRCLGTVLANESPGGEIEVLVIDGRSDDGTRAVVERFARADQRVRLLDNPKRTVPAALNLGLAQARGAIIMRVDAHSEYPPNYVAGLVGWLERSGADNVGGAWITRPADGSPTSLAIAFALSHPFGIGNARFRLGVREPQWVDTVPFGCYRREVLERLGGFDEDLVRNQDDELNMRLIRHGGRILLVPDVVCHYYARASIPKLWQTYYQYGYYKPLVARKLSGVFTWRQLVPPFFVATLGIAAVLSPIVPGVTAVLEAALALYAAALTIACVGGARRHGVRVGLLAALVFPVLHLSYGVGFLRGVLDFLVLRRAARPASEVPISR